jgi:hypothetical protein
LIALRQPIELEPKAIMTAKDKIAGRIFSMLELASASLMPGAPNGDGLFSLTARPARGNCI